MDSVVVDSVVVDSVVVDDVVAVVLSLVHLFMVAAVSAVGGSVVVVRLYSLFPGLSV